MPKSKSRKKNTPKRILALPELEHAKTAVLNSLTSASGQRTYEHAIREFVTWYCSEPRLAFNRNSGASIPDAPRTARIAGSGSAQRHCVGGFAAHQLEPDCCWLRESWAWARRVTGWL